MTENLNRTFYQVIIDQLKNSEAWPDYIAAILRVLPHQETNLEPGQDPARWAQLPGLCCQAAGGEKGWVDNLAVAWFLFYTAAHVFDTLEDQDLPDTWWSNQSPGVSLNVGTGLMISAAQRIDFLYRDHHTNNQAACIVEDFYQTILIMGSGQHRDLSQSYPKLDQWFANANAKSGEFFSLGCRSGARLASNDNILINSYSTYGRHLGLLLQIMDDLEDWQAYKESGHVDDSKWLLKSLPAAYAFAVLPKNRSDALRRCLDPQISKSGGLSDALQLIVDSGAELFFFTEIEKNYMLAQEALNAASPEPEAGKALMALLESLHPEKSP